MIVTSYETHLRQRKLLLLLFHRELVPGCAQNIKEAIPAASSTASRANELIPLHHLHTNASPSK